MTPIRWRRLLVSRTALAALLFVLFLDISGPDPRDKVRNAT
jgi:hypothetical protein